MSSCFLQFFCFGLHHVFTEKKIPHCYYYSYTSQQMVTANFFSWLTEAQHKESQVPIKMNYSGNRKNFITHSSLSKYISMITHSYPHKSINCLYVYWYIPAINQQQKHNEKKDVPDMLGRCLSTGALQA